MNSLFVEGLGLVTAAGLTCAQSTNSFLAGVTGFTEEVAGDQMELQVLAKVPADWRLRRTSSQWLVNLAARAGREAMAEAGAEPAQTLLICTPPEMYRDHACWAEMSPDTFLTDLQTKLGGTFAKGSRLVDGGAAAGVGLLPDVADALGQSSVSRVLLIGVDSLIGRADLDRFRTAGRLQGQTAQGLVPGEGAGAVVLSLNPCRGMAVRGVGLATEPDPVTGTRQSQGRGMVSALKAACASPDHPESDIIFAVSNLNGERYAALEMLVFRARFYRTHREYMATAYPAMSFGETGAAGGAIALAVAADAFRRGHAPGAHAMIEITSESGMRAGAFVSGV